MESDRSLCFLLGPYVFSVSFTQGWRTSTRAVKDKPLLLEIDQYCLSRHCCIFRQLYVKMREQICWEKYPVTLYEDPPVDGIPQVPNMQTLTSVNIQRPTNGRLTCKTANSISGFPGGKPLNDAEQLPPV